MDYCKGSGRSLGRDPGGTLGTLPCPRCGKELVPVRDIRGEGGFRAGSYEPVLTAPFHVRRRP